MKIFKLLLIAIFVMGSTSIAMADVIQFDADGVGTTHTATLMDELSGEATSLYDVITHLGDDGKLGDGDTFEESFTLGIDKANLVGSQVADYPDQAGGGFTPSLWAEIEITDGSVFNHSDGGTDATAANPEGILDDTFQIGITAGTVELYYDDGLGSSLHLASFDVIFGESTEYQPTGNDTLTAQVGLTVQSTFLASDVWFTAGGTDITTLGQDVIFGLADQSNNLIIFAGDDNGTSDLTDDDLIITVDDNGTDIEFQVVPEPTTLVLLGFGLLSMASIGRRKNIS